MNRKIIIKKCAECPHQSHRGAFGKVMCIPVCLKNRWELPYKIGTESGRKVAVGTDVIPSWCPLPKDGK